MPSVRVKEKHIHGQLSTSHHIHIIADSETWIEGNAVAQLETTAKLPHMLRVAGMPDLHAGRGYPVGAAFFSDRHFFPALIGNDIGCGMAFWQTGLSAAKLKPAKLAKQLGNIDTPLSQDEQEALLGESASDYPFSDDLAVGTIGGGNHFAELQTVETVYRDDLLPAAFDSNRLQLLVHSVRADWVSRFCDATSKPTAIEVWRKAARLRRTILPNIRQHLSSPV